MSESLRIQGQTLLSIFCCPCRSGQLLLKNMLKPLVMYPSLSVRVTEQQGEGTILALECLEESHEERSTPSQVYSKLLLVLKTLHSHLLGTVWLASMFHIPFKPGNMGRINRNVIHHIYCPCLPEIIFVFHFSDVSIGDRKLAAIFGELIWEEISQCIIHECLLYSIPTNSSQLEKFDSVRT